MLKDREEEHGAEGTVLGEMGMKSRKQLVINIRSSLLSVNNSWEEMHLKINDDDYGKRTDTRIW